MDSYPTEDSPFKIMRREWQPVAVSNDLKEGDIASFVLLNEDIVVARLSTGLLAAQNVCPHKGMKLNLGSVCEDRLQCAYHGWRFDREGHCLNIPSLINPPANILKVSRLKT